MSVRAAWDPGQYNRFAREREQPFWDLRALLGDGPSPVVVDLGCGDGRLTAALHRELGARSTLGIDSSPAMLEAAEAHAGDGVSFRSGDIRDWTGTRVDVVFSNAALHWVPYHDRVLGRWRDALAPRGQLAVQVPANSDHPSHRVAREMGAEWMGADAPADPVADNVLRPEDYARILHELGFTAQTVRLQVYSHLLDSAADVVEWVKGTSLTRFRAVLDAADYERFLGEYRRRLVDELGDARPYLYPFKRLLLWGRLSS